MTNREILIKAITQAITGGWEEPLEFGIEAYVDGVLNEPREWPSINDIIFNHEFARALWGKEEWILVEGEGWLQDSTNVYISGIALTLPAYKMHLQQMVIADDPIEYLGKHLDG